MKAYGGNFFGFIRVDDSYFTSLELTVYHDSGAFRPTVDNLYFAVPASGEVALLCLADLSVGRRRRA